ncbi:hypothetical protein J2T13_001619 [Paenibacillus sp. DS2015]
MEYVVFSSVIRLCETRVNTFVILIEGKEV